MARRQEEGWSQNKQRASRFFTDQHGRRYWAIVEKTTQMAVGDPSPEFRAPWLPDWKYARFRSSEEPNNDHFTWDYDQMTKDLVAASAEYYRKATQEAATRNWPLPRIGKPLYRQLRDIIGEPPKSPLLPAAAAKGDRWLILGEGRNPTLEALLAPQDTTDAFLAKLEAAITGTDVDDEYGGHTLAPGDEALMQEIVASGEADPNPQAVYGSKPVEDARPEPRKASEYQQFLTQQRKAGKSMAEAAQLWRERKTTFQPA